MKLQKYRAIFPYPYPYIFHNFFLILYSSFISDFAEEYSCINDDYDSTKEKGNGTDLDIQFKGLLYDFYTKDISQKVKTVTTEFKKQGKFLA